MAPGRWALPVLFALLRDLRWVARCADDAANAAAKQTLLTHEHMEECARLLNKAFSACAADRFPGVEQSKKWGTYAVVNMVFGTYFQVRRRHSQLTSSSNPSHCARISCAPWALQISRRSRRTRARMSSPTGTMWAASRSSMRTTLEYVDAWMRV